MFLISLPAAQFIGRKTSAGTFISFMATAGLEYYEAVLLEDYYRLHPVVRCSVCPLSVVPSRYCTHERKRSSADAEITQHASRWTHKLLSPKCKTPRVLSLMEPFPSFEAPVKLQCFQPRTPNTSLPGSQTITRSAQPQLTPTFTLIFTYLLLTLFTCQSYHACILMKLCNASNQIVKK